MIPPLGEAPMFLHALPANCGPMSVWQVLRRFGRRVGVARIVRACRHTQRDGCYGIALALALHEFGLRVAFHTDPDPAIEPREAECYATARRLGIPISPALELTELRRLVRRRPVIVYLAGTDGSGHFSPLIGFRRGRAILPYTENTELPVDEFASRWSGPGYPRQCMLVSVEPTAVRARAVRRWV